MVEDISRLVLNIEAEPDRPVGSDQLIVGLEVAISYPPQMSVTVTVIVAVSCHS